MILWSVRRHLPVVAIALVAVLFSAFAAVTPVRQVDAWTTGVPQASLITGTDTDIGRSVAVGPDGSIYVAGFFRSPTLAVTSSAQVVHVVTNSGGREAFLAKFNAQGQPEWLRSFGGSGDDYAEAVAVDGVDRITVVGYFSSTATFSASSPVEVRTSAGSDDGFVARFNADGVLQWVTTLGGSGTDQIVDVAVGPGGSIVVGGTVTGNVSVGALTSWANLGDTTDGDGLVAAFDDTGQASWSARVGGVGKDVVHKVARDRQGSVLAAGTVSTSASVVAMDATVAVTPDFGGGDAFLLKLSGGGHLASGWVRRFGGAGFDEALGVGGDTQGRVSVASTVTGDVTVGVQTYPAGTGNDILVTQFDASGTLRWGNRIGSGVSGTLDEPRHLAVAPDGQVVTTGRLGGSNTHIIALAHDINGEVVWGPTLIGNATNQIGQGVAVDEGGSVYLTGRFAGGRIDQSDASTDITVAGASDVLLVKYPSLFPPAPVPPPPLPPAVSELITRPVASPTTVPATTTPPTSTTTTSMPTATTTTTVARDQLRFEVVNGVVKLTTPAGGLLQLDGFARVGPSGIDVLSGSTLSLTAGGLAPAGAVRMELYSTPRLLWSGSAAADGSLNALFTVPTDVPAGPHTLRVVGRDAQGEFAGVLAVNVTTLGDRLPATGGEMPLLVAFATLAAGAAVVVLSNRRRLATAVRSRR